MSDDKRRGDPPPKQGYIPRPPTQADVDLVSSQQGMIEDEWSGEPTEPKRKPEAEDPERQPG
ncbi:hypothetical protein [Paracraurococcus lichenis]|uniref:Uncharacterized protein n=1 Tax=Paracraurococcus lichenis TaxID=3064888 RepID=A0ABT9E2S7_9PROT|nr:hypothetical protein [Paracraurococcus sp. LOR1-02]MDO9710469.1 hypothetical protein [Paracraurococcus sp. LOR1-02]